MPLRAAADPWVLRRRSAEQIVSRHTQATERRDIDRCSRCYLSQRQPLLAA